MRMNATRYRGNLQLVVFARVQTCYMGRAGPHGARGRAGVPVIGPKEKAVEYIIQIIAGLVTGNATGAAAKGVSLGTIGNSIAGAVGGLGGGLLLPGLVGNGNLDAILGGGIGGIVLTALAGAVKRAMNK